MMMLLGQSETEESSFFFGAENETGTWAVSQNGQLEGLEFFLTEDAGSASSVIDPIFNMEVVNNNRVIFTMDFSFTEVNPDFEIQVLTSGYSRVVLQRQ